MKLYEYIDAYIAETCDAIGDEFRAADVREWAAEKGFEFDVANALTQHRYHAEDRTFTTARIALGPKSRYQVIDTEDGVMSPSVMMMHRQLAEESARRWRKERETRMDSVALKSRKARRALREAEAQMAAVETLLNVRLEPDGDGED